MPKRKLEEFDRIQRDHDMDGLEEISILFIPFDAAKQHYRRNASRGVTGFKGTLDGTGLPIESGGPSQMLVPTGSYLEGEDIADELSKIVKQECELVRNMFNPDWEYEENVKRLAVSQAPSDTDTSQWPERWKAATQRKLKGYKHYPILLFLSENPTGKAFPDVIDARVDTTLPGMGYAYVKKFALDTTSVEGIRRVNEMAVYLREDYDRRVMGSVGEEDALYLEAEAIRRDTHGLYKGGKDEHILKVTIGRQVGYALTVAGVHLRATLTSTGPSDTREELRALQLYCEQRGIQLMVGDFNMDPQHSERGSRGAYFDRKSENQPRFLIGPGSHVAYPEFVQQFSNSTGNAHYMGYYQADTETLALAGPSVYGLLGGSVSRSIEGGPYYSDHPAIYVCVETRRMSPEAQDRLVRRKVLRVVRRMKT